MNIGLVVPGFSADASDWCIPALRHLARTLASRDDVRVIALRYPYTPGRYPVDNAEAIALGGGLSHGKATLRLWRDAFSVLRAEHRRRPFDVLHAFWATESGLLAAIAGRLLRVPTLVSLAGGELVGLRDIGYGDQLLVQERAKIAASLRLATAVSAGSRHYAERAERHLRSRRTVHVAPLGVDLALFSPASSGSTSCRIVHVGTLIAVKDQATLLHAFAQLRQDGFGARLEIVGDGPLRGELDALARKLGLGDRVCFRGAIDHAALPSTYRGAHAFVLSSRHEAQGMVALEAAACGVPVVGTRVGIVPELTSGAVPVGDAMGLARAIATAIKAGSSTGAADRIRAEYGLQACTDWFRGLYVDLQ